MKNEIKKLNQFMIIGYSEIGLLFILILFGILFSVTPETNKSLSNAYGIVIVVFGTLFAALNIASLIAIMITRWETEWCNDRKMLWGILGILISFIAILIFTILGKNNAKKDNDPNIKNDYYNDFPKEEEIDASLLSNKTKSNNNIEVYEALFGDKE